MQNSVFANTVIHDWSRSNTATTSSVAHLGAVAEYPVIAYETLLQAKAIAPAAVDGALVVAVAVQIELAGSIGRIRVIVRIIPTRSE